MYLIKFKSMTEKEIAKTLGLNLFSYKEKVKIINEREPHYQGFGARPSILKPTEKLWMTLLKYKTNLTYLQIANLFDVSEATCHRNIERITKILADYQEEKIVLEKIKLEKSKNILIVDATEIKKKDLK
jgi:predicted DNA-binding protein YlxM (UPF0122 family)